MKKKHMSKNTKTVLILLVIAVLIAVVPLFARKGASFGGSDDAGSVMVEEVRGASYEPWSTPVLENLLGGELPGEVESLIFCVQTGIGVGIIAFCMGRLVERKKWMKKYEKEQEETEEDGGIARDHAGDR
nr:energy-coupling factor ABC transporter substrate-binding protein [Lachnoclostridium sp. An118]